MGIKRGSASDHIFTFALVIVLLSSPCLQASRCSEDSIINAFLIIGPKGEQTQGSFVSIQQAINEAEDNSTIFVPPGTYYENVVVNKTVSLVGADNTTSVIDGGNIGTVVEVMANGVTIQSFRLQNSGYGWNRNGVYAHHADNCTIRNNYFYNVCHNIKVGFSSNSVILGNLINGKMTTPTMYGIRVENSTNCKVSNNSVSDCVAAIHLQNSTNCIANNNYLHNNSQGIRFYSPCTHNSILENFIVNNAYDGIITIMPGNSTFANNTIFHNSFINNTYTFIYNVPGFIWEDDYPSGGNYWSRYNGTDSYSGYYQNETGNDGIGDVAYPVGEDFYGNDEYPLMHPYGAICNLQTNRTYLTISSAITAPETIEGHTISVESGIYNEHLIINKTLSLIGENQTTTVLDGEETGTVVTIEANNVNIAGFMIRNSGTSFPPYGNDCGVLLDHCKNTNFSSNLVTDNRIGLYLFFSNSNIVEYNKVSSNSENGILLWYSGNNTLTQNIMTNNSHNFGTYGDTFADFNNTIDESNTVDGKPIYYIIGRQHETIEENTGAGALYLINCFNVTVHNLNITKNVHGIFGYNLTSSKIEEITATNNSYGICIQVSSNNTVMSNKCIDNWVGVYLQDSSGNKVENTVVESGEKGISLYDANGNTIDFNTVGNAFFGIRLFASSNNEIIHNNFIQNSEQVSLLSASYENTWDNGLEGNYWSNYSGNDANQDGIGDTSQIIDSDNSDRYPLLGAFHRFKVQDAEEKVEVTTNSTILDLVYNPIFGQISLTVNGSDESFGFCRIRIPHVLVEPEIEVIIDAGTTQIIYANYSLKDDGFRRWIYFEYQHSEHQITVMPEHSQLLLLCLLVSTVLAFVAKPKSENQRNFLKNEYASW